MITADDIRAFEASVAADFNAGKIRFPIHLDGGNEDALVRVFETIDRQDWLACSWRSHAKCLLHGVPPDELRAEIMSGRSMTICLPQYRVVSSAIVGGILPIALGIAFEIKRSGGTNKVHAFMGEMTSETGIAHECMKYAANFDLPIRWIVEDNLKSVLTKTRDVWNASTLDQESEFRRNPKAEYFRYDLTWPHAGAGKRVQF